MLLIGAVLPAIRNMYSFRTTSDLVGKSHNPDFTYLYILLTNIDYFLPTFTMCSLSSLLFLELQSSIEWKLSTYRMVCVNIPSSQVMSGEIKTVDVSIYFWRCIKKLSRRKFSALVLAVHCISQLNSDWIYEVIVSPKCQPKITKISALPSKKLPGQKSR